MAEQQWSCKWLAVVLVLTLLSTVAGVSACSGPAVPPQYPYSPPETSPPETEPSIRPPNSPSGLIGASVSQSAVSLQWSDNSNNEDGFNVYRDGTKVASVSANSTTYQDTGLEAGKTYQYSVRAYNEAGESGSCSCSAKTPNPPLNVTINHIGVKFDHDPLDIQGPGDIRLVLVISDGNQTIEEIIPPGEGIYRLNDYETTELNQRIFHAASVGEYLKICIIAYDDDPETLVSNLLQAALPVLGPLVGIPDVSGISAIFSAYEEQTGKSLFENKDDYVGYFEGFWGSDESWGMGQHNAVGTEDFRVWLSIWSDSQPVAIPRPTLLPNVVIQSIDVPAEVEVGKYYTYNVILRDNESRSVTVTLKIHSSVTGDISSQSVTVPANSTRDVEQKTKFEPAGVRTVTYTILYDGQELDSVSRTVEAESFLPNVVIQSVDVPAEVEVGKNYTYHITLVNNESHSLTVTLKIRSSVTGGVGSKSVTVPANGNIVVTDTTKFEPAGVRTLTYTILYQGIELDSLTKTVEARAPTPTPTPPPLSVNFDGWYVGSNKVNTTTKDNTVTARLIVSYGNPGQYKMRIRRDIRLSSDQTISEISFSYDGASATKELSFKPPYATDEASTDGYHIDLVKDGYIVWTLADAYPPRLRVTIP